MQTNEELDKEIDKLFEDVVDEPTGDDLSALGENEQTDDNQETPDDSEKDEESGDEDKEKQEDEKEGKPEKETGVANLRKFGERQKARADELQTKLEEVSKTVEVLQDFGGVEEVAKLVTEFGGVEQAKVSLELKSLVDDGTSDPRQLIDKASKLIPDTMNALITHIGDEIGEAMYKQTQLDLFGKELSEDEQQRVRDFVLYGIEGTKDDIPEDLLQDEFGNPLPEKVVQALRFERNANKRNEARLKQLETQINSRVNSIESRHQESAINSAMQNWFSPMAENLDKLNLLKPVPGETPEDAQFRVEQAGILNALTFHFFSQDEIGAKALDDAKELLNKNDRLSAAKLKDLEKVILKRSKAAADKAAAFVSPNVSAKAGKTKAEVSKQKVSSVSATGSRGGSAKTADSWDAITVDTLGI